VGVQLSEDEAWDVLATSHTGILTSLRSDGFPVTLPVWFVVEDRAVYVSGSASTHKFTRVRRDDRVSFLVESGLKWAELQAVHFTAHAEHVTDPDWARIDAMFEAKYAGFRTPRAEMPEATQRAYNAARALLRLRPEGGFLSWDNSRLGTADTPRTR
jgi:general stress protein 26